STRCQALFSLAQACFNATVTPRGAWLVLPIVGIPLAIDRFCSRFEHVFKRPEQREHFRSFVTGLVCSENRTIAGIHQRLVFGPDYDSLHHFMTKSPWCVDSLQEQRLQLIKEYVGRPKPSPALSNGNANAIGCMEGSSADSELPARFVPLEVTPRKLPAEVFDAKQPCVIAIDPTFIHHTGEKIYGTYWYWDYARRGFVTAQRLVLSILVTPEHLVPLGWKLFHRGFLEEQKVYLETMKPAADADELAWEEYNGLVEQYERNKKGHTTQPQLAEQLVDECERLGISKDAYVCDAAILTKELGNHIDSYGKAWVSKLAKSRLVQTANGAFETIEAFAKSLPKDVFRPVQVKTRHGEERTYWCFTKTVMVHDWKRLRVVISYDNEDLDGELSSVNPFCLSRQFKFAA
ncbi:MAG: hypothetical protein ACRDHZ_25270, partial [Ktedonobacteraceae bacterium]